MTVSEDYTYVADGIAGLQVIDITSPALLQQAGSVDTPGIARGVAVSGHVIFIADRESGLKTSLIQCEPQVYPANTVSPLE